MRRLLLTNFLSMIILFVSGQSFYGDQELSIDNQIFLSKSHLDSLVNVGDYYLVHKSCGDFRYCECKDSISKSFNFKFISVAKLHCDAYSKGASDTIDHFNRVMDSCISRVNGENWESRFDSIVKICANRKCFRDEEIDSFVKSSTLSGVTIYFDYKKHKLNDKLICAIDNVALPTLKKWPNLKVILSGNSSFDEMDSTKIISLNRAIAVKKYLISKGINENRITIENNGYLKGVYSNNPRDRRNQSRQNRRVNFSWTN